MTSPDTFVAGYGSLRSTAGRALIPHAETAEGQLYQVLIKGLTPAFNARMTFSKSNSNQKRTPGETALGVTRSPTGILEATLFQVTDSQLKALAIRETTASQRTKLSNETIIFTDEQKPKKEMNVWIYEPKFPKSPDLEYPLNQSYVDVVLMGYYEVGKEEAVRRFVQTVRGWEGPWINDRETPQYPRALDYSDQKNQKLVKIFDAILQENQQEAMQERIKL